MMGLAQLADYNHWEMFLSATGSDKVVQIIYGDRL